MPADQHTEVKEKLRMYAKLQMDAWGALFSEMSMSPVHNNYTEEEQEFVTNMSLETQTYYDNIDEIAEDFIKDQVSQSLMQAAMSPYMKKYGGDAE